MTAQSIRELCPATAVPHCTASTPSHEHNSGAINMQSAHSVYFGQPNIQPNLGPPFRPTLLAILQISQM